MMRAVAKQVRLEHAPARPLAAIRTTAGTGPLGPAIIGTLDKIWPVLRGQGARTGHNVIIYRSAAEGTLVLDVGVEVFGDVAVDGELRLTATPAGEVATVAHFGEYSEMEPAYAALEQWCADNNRQRSGVSWEVYGDWDDDPARRRTDIYFGLRAQPPADGDGLARSE